MRFINFTVFALLVSANVFSQEADKMSGFKYLFKDNTEKGLNFTTFYGEIAPTTAWANLNTTFGKVFLAEFGLILNNKITIGYYLARSPKKNQVPVPQQGTPEYDDWLSYGIKLDQLSPDTEVTYVYFSHSGINLSYLFKSNNIVFWRTGLRFGSGKLEILEDQRQLFDFFNTSIYEAKALNVNPEVGIGVNLRKWWRLHADAGYRIVFAQTEKAIDKRDYYGLTFKVGFSFGKFAN